MEAIIFRVMFNNENWSARCKYPDKDSLCSPCFDRKVNIRPPKPSDEECSASPPCWESQLCLSYEWGAAKGKKFSKRAYPAMKAFFVFRQPDSKYYTLWGRSTVESVNVPPTGEKSASVKGGYTQYIRFRPFDPLPRHKWVEDLTDDDLVGDKPWLRGRYRYITANQEAGLERRIEGLVPQKTAQSPVTVSVPDKVTLTIDVTTTMYGRLESAANEDGRQIDEIVRQAIAEWLKGRRE